MGMTVLETRWARSDRCRTLAEIDLEIALAVTEAPPVYQTISETAWQLRCLGMTLRQIGEKLGVDRTTIRKAIRWRAAILREELGEGLVERWQDRGGTDPSSGRSLR